MPKTPNLAFFFDTLSDARSPALAYYIVGYLYRTNLNIASYSGRDKGVPRPLQDFCRTTITVCEIYSRAKSPLISGTAQNFAIMFRLLLYSVASLDRAYRLRIWQLGDLDLLL